MIREGHKLPEDVIDRIPVLIERIEKDTDIVAFYTFGSLATGDLKPLSDLDFARLEPSFDFSVMTINFQNSGTANLNHRLFGDFFAES